MRLAYAAAANAARMAALLAPPGSGKFVRALRARRGLVSRLTARAQAIRDSSRPLVWLHAPSVGEGLQARPVAHALRERHPDWQMAYTFFSPSAEGFAASISADITDYLPFDRAADADALLDAIRPSILVFAKLDVWPILVERAAARRVPVALISGTLAAASSRRGWWSELLVHDAYAALTSVGAIDAEHGERLHSLGVPRSAIRVTGDTRFDQVWQRAQTIDRNSGPLSRFASARTTLVAGSTWPADEAVLLAAWPQFHAMAAAPRLIIAPHEPTDVHCAHVETWASERSMRLVRYTRVAAGAPLNDADVILVDRVGVLGELYALADMAFVGGGFHRAGLHSAIEPAAFGVPVVFGPHHTMSREAGLLLSASAAHAIRDDDSLATLLRVWISDEARRRFEGSAGRAVVERELGATARSVDLIERVLSANRAT